MSCRLSRVALAWAVVVLGPARAAVTIDAVANGVRLDLKTVAKPLALDAGTYWLQADGAIYYGEAPEVRKSPCSEAVLNADPAVVRLDTNDGLPLSLAVIDCYEGLSIAVQARTTVYLFLCDRDTSGNAGQVTVQVRRRTGDQSQPVASVSLDAVANCYALPLDAKAVRVELQPGTYCLKLTDSSLHYADGSGVRGREPCHVLIDCNPAAVAISWDDVNDTPVGTRVLSGRGDELYVGVLKPTALRLYIAHSAARSYAGRVVVSVRRVRAEG